MTAARRCHSRYRREWELVFLLCPAHGVALLPPSPSCACAYWRSVCAASQVAPNSDHFQTLMVAMMELSTPTAAANETALEERSVSAVLSAWDKEASSTGLHLRLLQGDHEGAQVRIPQTQTLRVRDEDNSAVHRRFEASEIAKLKLRDN